MGVRGRVVSGVTIREMKELMMENMMASPAPFPKLEGVVQNLMTQYVRRRINVVLRLVGVVGVRGRRVFGVARVRRRDIRDVIMENMMEDFHLLYLLQTDVRFLNTVSLQVQVEDVVRRTTRGAAG